MADRYGLFKWAAPGFLAAAGMIVLLGMPDEDTGSADPSMAEEQRASERLAELALEASRKSAEALELSREREETDRKYSIEYAPPFEVLPRKDDLEMYPCSDCHEDEEPNFDERELEYEHEDLVLDHGGGRLWCHNCHDPEDPGTLISLKADPIDMDNAYLLCGECHFRQQKDWYFGGHGKRVRTWSGPRRIYSCPQCHDPHSPSIKPFDPEPPPLPRKGLVRAEHREEPAEKIWERLAAEEE
jgi:hypothetical protein